MDPRHQPSSPRRAGSDHLAAVVGVGGTQETVADHGHGTEAFARPRAGLRA